MLSHEIGVTAVKARVAIVGRWGNTEGLLAERIRELVFELETEPSREAPDGAELKLI